MTISASAEVARASFSHLASESVFTESSIGVSNGRVLFSTSISNDCAFVMTTSGSSCATSVILSLHSSCASTTLLGLVGTCDCVSVCLALQGSIRPL